MQPLSTKHHGHNIPHVHHEVLCDYTHRLNKEYDILPFTWIEYFLVRINNLIRHSMRWKNTYNIKYDKTSQTITITGFPTKTLKHGFKIGIMQTEYTLHKMDYKQAIIYMYGKNYVKLEFHTKKPSGEPCVKVAYLQGEEDLDNALTPDDCNILTEQTTYDCCNCCKYKKQCMEETSNDVSKGEEGVADGESGTSGGESGTTTTGNSESGNSDGNNDTVDDGTSIVNP